MWYSLSEFITDSSSFFIVPDDSTTPSSDSVNRPTKHREMSQHIMFDDEWLFCCLKHYFKSSHRFWLLVYLRLSLSTEWILCRRFKCLPVDSSDGILWLPADSELCRSSALDLRRVLSSWSTSRAFSTFSLYRRLRGWISSGGLTTQASFAVVPLCTLLDWSMFTTSDISSVARIVFASSTPLNLLQLSKRRRRSKRTANSDR